MQSIEPQQSREVVHELAAGWQQKFPPGCAPHAKSPQQADDPGVQVRPCAMHIDPSPDDPSPVDPSIRGTSIPVIPPSPPDIPPVSPPDIPPVSPDMLPSAPVPASIIAVRHAPL